MEMASVPELLVECEAVTFSTDPFYTYTSGIQAPIYTDNRRMTGYVDARNIIVDALVENAKSFGVEFGAVAGTATAGIAWAALAADKLHLPMMYVRAKSKGHGADKMVEGYGPEGAQ